MNNEFNINNFESKVFFIGYNKTATTTIHKLFAKNKVKSLHSRRWGLKNFQIFSDTGDILNPKVKYDYENYLKRYPQSLCVLNTRSLDGWLYSRCRHYYWRGTHPGKPDFGYPVDRDMIKLWVENRNKYYVDLLRYFLDYPAKLAIIDIDDDYWIRFLCDFLDLEYHNIWVNKSEADGDLYTRQWKKREINEISPDYLNLIKESIMGAYHDLNIKDGSSSLLIRSLTDNDDYRNIYEGLNTFKNNISVKLMTK
jgi:hypothetical protein